MFGNTVQVDYERKYNPHRPDRLKDVDYDTPKDFTNMSMTEIKEYKQKWLEVDHLHYPNQNWRYRNARWEKLNYENYTKYGYSKSEGKRKAFFKTISLFTGRTVEFVAQSLFVGVAFYLIYKIYI